MSNKEIIRKFVELFNQGDYDGLAELYHESAINHQVAVDPVEGKEAVREMFRREFENAEMTCIPENLFEDGDWVIMEWKDPKGLRGCGFFKLRDHKIEFQRGYWDMLTLLRTHKLPLPTD